MDSRWGCRIPKMSGGLLVGWQAGTTIFTGGGGGFTAYAVCANQAS
jgi:hypothetical protein